MTATEQQTIVVVGNGMVGLRFCEQLTAFDERKRFRIVTFCEESRSAYDRVGLTNFFAHRDAEKLMLARREWYESAGIELHIGDRAIQIDRKRCVVRSQKGVQIGYDKLILATGSFPFVPPVPGIQKQGIFVYRTIEDLEHIITCSKKSKSCAVIGGGLLGLEAAKAAFDLGMETHVIEFASRLMPRQLDEAGSRTLLQKIRAIGVQVHLGKSSKEIHGDGSIRQIEFTDGTSLDCDMLIVSAGIRPRDDQAVRPECRRAWRYRRQRPAADERSEHLCDWRMCSSRRHDLRTGSARLCDGRNSRRQFLRRRPDV
jgi:nitrite reductase (NADH) large subunit